MVLTMVGAPMPRTVPPTSRALYARQVRPRKRTIRGDGIEAALGPGRDCPVGLPPKVVASVRQG